MLPCFPAVLIYVCCSEQVFNVELISSNVMCIHICHSYIWQMGGHAMSVVLRVTVYLHSDILFSTTASLALLFIPAISGQR